MTKTTQENQEVAKLLGDILNELKEGNRGNSYDDWITNSELIIKLGISKRTAALWRSRGIIPFSKLAGSYYYRKSIINEILLKKFNQKIN